MRRFAVPEFGDARWLPARTRRQLTTLLSWQTCHYDLYSRAAPIVTRLLGRARSGRVLDLASGSAGPWPKLLEAIDRSDVSVTLTDAYPQPERWRAIGDARLRAHEAAVRLPMVPRELGDVWTLFSALHHLDAASICTLLAAAQRAMIPFGAFEFTSRSITAPFKLLRGAPELVRDARRALGDDFRWRHLPTLLATYLWDASASHWRSWEPEELRAMIPARCASYHWQVGRTGERDGGLTWLLGLPSRANSRRSR